MTPPDRTHGRHHQETVRPLAVDAVDQAQERRRMARFQDDLAALRRSVDAAEARAGVGPMDEEFLDFVDNAPIGMHQVDPDGRVLWVNRFELEMLGYDRSEVVGRDVRDFHVDAGVVEDIFERITRGEVVRGQHGVLRRKDGTLLPVLIASSGLVRDGRLVRSRCIVRPVEDLAVSERTLLRRDRQQATVARIGHLALSSNDLDALFATACREVSEATGADTCGLLERVSEDELTLRAAHGFAPGFDPRVPGGRGTTAGFVLDAGRTVVYGDLRNETRFTPSPILLQEGMVSGMGCVIHAQAGPWGVIGVHSRSPRDFDLDDANFLEAIAHVLGSAIDRRRAEADLQRSRDRLETIVLERTQRLEQANRELDAFSSAVSHDLRGPVRAIAGFSSLIAQRHAGRLDPHGRELLEEVRRAASRMGDLIEDLLDLSRADRVTPNLQDVDLSALAMAILEGEAERTPQREVRWDVEPGLVVHGDPDLLRMALENLLSNAWKFTSRTKEARISVSRRRHGEEDVLCVQDNGAGFDMADAGRLFQPFQRLHRRSDYEGTGIGLATVRRIVERHGGRIWAQGRPGGGASFYFTLPSREQDAAFPG